MKLSIQIQSAYDGQVYDISEVAQQTIITQNIDGTAGKLTTTLVKDPEQLLNLKNKSLCNGSKIWFKVDGEGVFFGFIFKIGTDMEGNYRITAYDSLRYLKNSDIAYYDGISASDIFKQICEKWAIPYEIKTPTTFIPPKFSSANSTLYATIERGMKLASVNDKRQYFLADRFGTLVWSAFDAEETDVQLGDGSFVTSYTYEKSIDEDTYNKIKLYRENETTGKVDTWYVEDTNNIQRWGTLQLLKQADEKMNDAQIKKQASDLLYTKNRETETLKIQALGIMKLTCGRGIKLVIDSEGINKWLWIISSTHRFTKYEHTMDLEVFI